jgi:hypothetical protein
VTGGKKYEVNSPVPCVVSMTWSGSQLANGKTAFSVVPAGCTLTRAELRADAAVTATIDIERADYTTWSGTGSGASIIGGGTGLSISAATKNQDTDLSNNSWTSRVLVTGDTVEGILSGVTVGSATTLTLVMWGTR